MASQHRRKTIKMTGRLIICTGLLLSANSFAQETGIASQYPGDIGIGSDPRVILFDGFEPYSQPADALQRQGGKWTEQSASSHCRISTAQHFAGVKSYEMDMPIGTGELSITL